MKTFITFICFASVVVLIQASLSDDDKNKIKNIHRECQDNPATHVDEDLLRKFHKGEEADTATIGPHMLCMSSKMGIISSEGKVDKDKLKQGLSRFISEETKLKEVVEQCGVEKATAVDTALAVDKCFREHVGHDDHHHHH